MKTICKEKSNDFAELILRSYELIRDNQQIKELYGNKFKNILIDEFQDTNEIQFKWIKNLTGTDTTVTAVDDDQSIYGWRGQSEAQISSKRKKAIVRLGQNYRSTQKILNAANAVIGKNSNRLEKALTEGNKNVLRCMKLIMSKKKPTMSQKMCIKYFLVGITTKILLFFIDQTLSLELLKNTY